eukprot:c23423_g1_i1 orf=89-307(+)
MQLKLHMNSSISPLFNFSQVKSLYWVVTTVNKLSFELKQAFLLNSIHANFPGLKQQSSASRALIEINLKTMY